jgi:CheY-like chemotaxis protein
MVAAYEGKVFLIEDDDLLRESVSDALEHERFLVLPGRHGREALARMHGALPPRVAVIDLLMPGMNGYELIAAMKADPKLRSIPIIVVSGERRISVPDAQYVLTKPFELDKLVDAVRRCCSLDAAAADAERAARA